MSAGCKNSFWVFYFLYSALSLSLSALCVLPERNHCQSCCWCSLRLSRGSRSDPSGFVPKWGVKHTHRKADVCEKGHLPPSLCTNTPEHQCLVRQRTNIPPSLNLHTLHRLRYHVFFLKIIRLKWIESAGLCSHEWTSGTGRWRGIIMSPQSSECYGTERWMPR